MVDLVLRQQHSAATAAGASAAMQAVFGVGVASVDSLGALQYERRSLVDDGISATRITSRGALLHVRTDPAPDMVVIAVRSGYLVLKQGPQTIALEAGDLGLIPLEQSTQANWEEMEADLYSFPRSSLAHLLGFEGEDLALRVARLKAVSPEVTALWLRTASLLGGDVLARPRMYESDLIREQTIDLLLGLTIEAFGISDAREDGTDDDGKVQRATAYMRANLGRPISVAEVARAVGLSVRGLQLAFQRTGRATPLSSLRALRMTAAHDALTTITSDDHASLAVIARQVGYTNLGRFEAHYRDAFHRTPTETVHAADTRDPAAAQTR